MRGHGKFLSRFAGAALAAAAGLFAGTASAQDFELHPATIEGTIELGDDVVLTSGSVSASSYDPDTGQSHSASAQISFPSGGGNSGTYSLTVEAGASGLTYTLYASAYSNTSSGYVQLSIPGGSVSVTEGDTSTKDISFPDYHLGSVDVTMEVTGDGTFTGGGVSFNSYDSSTGISAYGSGPVPAGGTATLLAAPGSVSASAWAYVSVDGGPTATYYMGSQSFTLSSGGTASLLYSLAVDASDPGSISGVVELNGTEVDSIYVSAYGGNPWQYYSSDASGGSYSFDPANVGSWSVYAYAYDYNADGSYAYFSFPSQYVSVAAGQDVLVDFVEDAATAGGTFSMGDWKEPVYSSISVYGSASDGASGGWSRSFNNESPPSSMDWGMILNGDTNWNYLYAQFYGQYYDDSCYSYTNTSAVVDGGNFGAVEAGDDFALDIDALDYNVATVTLNLTVAGGGTLSNPYVSGSGYLYGPDGAYLQGTYAYGSGSGQTDVTTGSVTLYLPPGTYDLQAYAYVNGSWTSFGQLHNYVVEEGDVVDADLDAPTLALGSPEPFAEFDCHDGVTVSGTVSDTSGVASLTVNGEDVDVDEDGSFSATVEDLEPGTHVIEIVAVDTNGNTLSLGRTVVVLECDEEEDTTAPTVTASAGSQPNEYGWYNAPVTITFSATDDVGVESLTSPITLSSDGAGQSATGTATDAAGNTGSVTVSGIHIDQAAPSVTASSDPECLWSPNHKMVEVTISGKVTDLSGARTIAGYTITSNEKDDDKGDGKTAGDCNGKDGYTSAASFSDSISVDASGNFSFQTKLRAERSGNNQGRTYTIAFKVVDLAGNQTCVSVKVCVPHNQ